MQAIFKVVVDGADITPQVQDRLISLTVTDKQGIESDSFRLVLDNREGKIALPDTRVEVQIAMGVESVQPLGRFIVDHVEESHPPRTLTISGASVNLTGALKSHKQRNWDETTLEVVLWDISIEHNLDLALHDYFLGIEIDHLDQTAESDLALVQRLAQDYDALFKIAENHLVFTLSDASERLSGQPLEYISIDAQQLINWRYAQAERNQITQVKTKWRDTDQSNEAWEEVGENGVTHIASKLYRSQADAKSSASEILRKLQTPQETLNLTLSVTANQAPIKAESALNISGLSNQIDGSWVTTAATHKLSQSGYQVSIDAKRLHT